MLKVMLLVIVVVTAEDSVFGRIKSGLQMAGKLLGVDHTDGVANLVTKAFGKTHKKGDGGQGANVFSGFLRMLGFDAKKIGAIAINAIIFVAQLISSSLARPPVSQLTHARTLREGSPLDWMMSSPQVIQLFSDIKDPELPNHIINFIKERSLDEDTGCVQLLVCKGAPFVWGMQKVLDVTPNSTTTGSKSLYTYLPTLDQVMDHADACERKHRYCTVHV